MVTSLSKIFRIKRRVSWRRDGKEGVKRGEERERGEAKKYATEAREEGREKGGKEVRSCTAYLPCIKELEGSIMELRGIRRASCLPS